MIKIDEAIAVNYRNTARYDAWLADIGKKYDLGPGSEAGVTNTDKDVYALRFGPGKGDFSKKITILVVNFSIGKQDQSGYITHYGVTTRKEGVEFIGGKYRTKSGLELKPVPQSVKNLRDLIPLLKEASDEGYIGTSVNTRRQGTDITYDQVAHASTDVERTKKFYNNARERVPFTGVTATGKTINFKANSMEAETFWMNRVFNDTQAAINATLSAMKKEIDNDVYSLDAIISAYTELDAHGNETSVEAQINYDAPYVMNITRTPEEIVILDDYIRKMYAKFEELFLDRVSDGKNRLKYGLMIVTNLMITKGLESMTTFKLPYYTETLKMIDKMRTEGWGDTISSFGKFFDQMYGIGDQRRLIEHTLEILKDVIQILEGDKFKIKYVEDGDEVTVQFIWEAKAPIPQQALNNLAKVLAIGRGSLKVKDLKYMLPVAISISKKKGRQIYKDLTTIFKMSDPNANELAFYTKALLSDLKSARNKRLINKLLLRMSTNENLASSALFISAHHLNESK